MKLIATTILVASTLSSLAFAQEAKKLKIPHSHHAAHGGLVLMAGDDHLELQKTGQVVRIHLTDKFRESVTADQFELSILLSAQGKTSKLEHKVDSKDPSFVEVTIGKEASEESFLEITATRKNPPKGYMVSKKAQKAQLKKIPEAHKNQHKKHK